MSEYTPAVPSLAFRDIQFDVIDRNGQPWLKASQIAEALGYAREDAVSTLYRRNADEFTEAMTLNVKLTVKGYGGGNSEKDVRIFSLRGAHLLAMFARTVVAKAFRRWALDVLDSVTGNPQPSSPVPTPAPFTSPTFLNLRYEGHPLRITRMAGGYWYGSSGLARALGWIDSGSITRHLCGADQVRVVPNKGRSLMVIDHATMMVMVERAKPHLAQRFLRWLGSALRSNYGEQAPALPAPLDPLERVTGDARQLGLDWYAECRQAVHAAGGRMPALDAAAVQRAADGMAAQLVADRRWELRFDRAGLPHLKGFPDKTLVLDLDDVGALAQLVHRQTDAAALQALLDAGLKRLTALASPLP